MKSAIVFNIQRFSLHDGPGIRTIVFLKGCPLHCQWCDNPESRNGNPELGVIVSRCNRCNNGKEKCVEVCPKKAITFDGQGTIRLNRELCDACGECARVCYFKALNVYGKKSTVEKVFDEVSKDKEFYHDCGGGLTVSGGEPLWQGFFVSKLFEMCRNAGINTFMETCGFANSSTLRDVLEFTDFVRFDIKHLNPQIHKKLTGQTNARILANAKLVAGSGVSMICSIPLIPDINDTPENIKDTAHFVRKLGDHVTIELFPYHRLGLPKYKALDLSYPFEGKVACTLGHAEEVRQAFEGYGVRCSVSK